MFKVLAELVAIVCIFRFYFGLTWTLDRIASLLSLVSSCSLVRNLKFRDAREMEFAVIFRIADYSLSLENPSESSHASIIKAIIGALARLLAFAN